MLKFNEFRHNHHPSGVKMLAKFILRGFSVFSILERQPTSARVECNRQIEVSRDDWVTRVETSSVMTSDKEYFHLTNVLNAFEGSTRVFTKSWSSKIRREMV